MPNDSILQVRELRKAYSARGWMSSRHTVLAGVDLDVRRGSTLALVGASGAGKSTLARCIAFREVADSGEIRYEGRPIDATDKAALRRLRRVVQLIPQDPGASLNPWRTAVEIVQEPMLVAGEDDSFRRGLDLMACVGLAAPAASSLAAQFSGGERARLALARALACNPVLLILDESLASLDLSTQAQIVNLMIDLQVRLGLTYVVIAHDLELVGHIADQVAVVHEGRIVETGPPLDLFRTPSHPQTRLLVEAMCGLHLPALR